MSLWVSASACENDRIRVKAEVRTGLLCHAVPVQKENVNTRKSFEKRRRKGGTRGAKKRSLQESLTSREPRRERQKADPVAKRKAPDEDASSSRTGVTSVEDPNRRSQRTRRKRKEIDLEFLRSLWLTRG